MDRKPFLPVPDPVAFKLFGLEIRWYAIMLVLGIVVGVMLCMKRAPRYGLNSDKVLDMMLWVVPIGTIGSRLYYVIFEWDQYKDNLLQIFNFRGGGLAIHGAIIAGLIVIVILLKRWHHSLWRWVDLLAPGLVLAQAIGRWGNYFNSEAHGGPTNLPWAIYADGEFVHPTFLYESIWCLLVCIFLIWFDDRGKKKFEGQIFLMYAILYSAERFFVEGLRTDSLYIGPFRQAQVISVCTIIAAIAFWIILRKKPLPDYSDSEVGPIKENL